MIDLNATAHRLLDAAENLTQTHGFNAFSFRDLQAEVGIKTSSIHYYFPTKKALASALITRYTDKFQITLSQISSTYINSNERLRAFTQIYLDTLEQGKFCLCGMLSSDMSTLPESTHQQLDHFFQMIEAWIEQSILLACDTVILPDMSVHNNCTRSHIKISAQSMLAQLEGGMLIARVRQNSRYFETMIEALFET